MPRTWSRVIAMTCSPARWWTSLTATGRTTPAEPRPQSAAPGADGRPPELGEALARRAIFVPPRPQSRRGQPQVVLLRGADSAMQLMGDRVHYPRAHAGRSVT